MNIGEIFVRDPDVAIVAHLCLNKDKVSRKEGLTLKALRTEINEAKLTKTGKIIGEFVLDHYASVCFMTSADVAQKLNVSESSVVRFSKALGYYGYADFQKNLQKYYKTKVNSISSAITVPAERLAYINHSNDGEQVHYIEAHFENTLNNLENGIVNNSKEKFDQAATMIIESKRKYILASRANTCQGDYCLLYLKHMLDNVISTSYGAINIIDHICDIGPEDCIIVFSFPRYSKTDEQAIQMAVEQGAKIIVISDKQSALLSQYATILFTVSVDSNTFFNSYIGVQFVTEVLCNAISQTLGSSIENRLTQIDKYLSPSGAW